MVVNARAMAAPDKYSAPILIQTGMFRCRPRRRLYLSLTAPGGLRPDERSALVMAAASEEFRFFASDEFSCNVSSKRPSRLLRQLYVRVCRRSVVAGGRRLQFNVFAGVCSSGVTQKSANRRGGFGMALRRFHSQRETDEVDGLQPRHALIPLTARWNGLYLHALSADRAMAVIYATVTTATVGWTVGSVRA